MRTVHLGGWRSVIGGILLGGTFWLPSIVIHYVRADAFGSLGDIVTLTVLSVASAALGYRLSGGETTSSRPIALRFLLGVWLLGPLASAVIAVWSQSGGKDLGELTRSTLFLTLGFPLSAWVISAYLGTLAALIIVTLWLVLVVVRSPTQDDGKAA